MRIRFVWTILFSMIVLSGIIPFNIYLAGFDTPAGRLQAGFYSLVIIETMLVFLISFTVVNEYFTLHPPPLSKIIEYHKEEHPEIPAQYYEDPKKRAAELNESGQTNRLNKQTIVSGKQSEPNSDNQ